MAAFRAAVEVGAHAVETDLHMSQDGVVVLSHVRVCVLAGSPSAGMLPGLLLAPL